MPVTSPSPRGARRRPTTLRDVAEAAGVSIKTVSNVVREHPHVAPGTRRRVQRAIQELGYRPQVAAQQLRTGSSGVLTLAVPSLTFSYFSELAQVFIEEAQARGRTVILHSTSAGHDEEATVLEGFRRRLGDGVIFNPLRLREDEIAAIDRVSQPTVFIGEHVPDQSLPEGADYVRVDNVGAVREATEHLLAQGCRRPVFLGTLAHALGQQPHSSAVLRVAGFRIACEACGREVGPADLRTVRDWDRTSGLESLEVLLEEVPEVDGIVCANDDLAIGVLAGLRRAGRRVPEDVAVVGYDDSPDAPFTSPPLSSISPDKHFLARMALDLLRDRIAGHDGPPRVVTTPHHLAVRESSHRPSH